MDILNIQTLSRSICNLYINQNPIRYWLESYFSNSTWKVSVFFVFLVHIFPHSDWIWEIPSISMDSVRMLESTDQKNSKYGDFLHSDSWCLWSMVKTIRSQSIEKLKIYLISYCLNFVETQSFHRISRPGK